MRNQSNNIQSGYLWALHDKKYNLIQNLIAGTARRGTIKRIKQIKKEQERIRNNHE